MGMQWERREGPECSKAEAARRSSPTSRPRTQNKLRYLLGQRFGPGKRGLGPSVSTRPELTASGSPEEEYVSGVDYLSRPERQRQALSSPRVSVNGEKNQRLQKTSASSITFKKAFPLFPEGEGSQHAPV